MLTVSDLSVAYGGTRAVRSVSLHVDQGEIVGIVGTNGAGKSTLLTTIAGLHRPVEGDIHFEGESLLRIVPEDIVRRGVALVPERRHIFHGMTVRENLKMGGLHRKDKAAVAADQEHVLALFPVLDRFLASRAGGLSGGEQQMLALARALMGRPRLLLMDEPSLGLGPKIIDGFFKDIESLRKDGLTILLVEQSVDRLLQTADRLYVLRSGRMELEGIASELSRQAVQDAYFGIADDEVVRTP
jgi:branched-chain amino acid transport system ATP-binding protein